MMVSIRRCVSALACGAALAGAALFPACSGKQPDEPAVATPSLALNHDRVPIGSPVKLTYRFQVAPDAKIDGDYWVFVHVLDPEGEQLWTEDHLPPVPTSSWKPGQSVDYTRTVFAPNYPYIGEALVRLGLYSPPTGKRLTLAGQEVSRREYLVGKFQLLPQSENVFLIYKDGWHPSEVAAENAASEWQWTKKNATISFRNPKKDVLFFLDYDARSELFTPPQQIVLKINGQQFASFVADSKDRKLLTFPITAAQLGPREIAEMGFEIDRTFTPGGGDARDLGIRVFHAFIDPRK
jgi:hypothetical protein